LAGPVQGAIGNKFGNGSLGQIKQTLDNGNGATGIGTGAPRNVQLALKLMF
jgi:hypothetical protein